MPGPIILECYMSERPADMREQAGTLSQTILIPVQPSSLQPTKCPSTSMSLNFLICASGTEVTISPKNAVRRQGTLDTEDVSSLSLICWETAQGQTYGAGGKADWARCRGWPRAGYRGMFVA